MNWIQVLLIAAIIALLVYLLRSRTNAKAKAWVKVGYVLFVIAAVYAILRPDDTTVVANWLGVRRGADLIEYALIIAFVFTTMSTYLRFKDLELKYARLARAVALRRSVLGRPARVSDKPTSELPDRRKYVDGPAHALVERDLRAPAQHLSAPADVQAGPLQVAQPRGWNSGSSGAPTALATAVCSCRSEVSTPGADVEPLPATRAARRP